MPIRSGAVHVLHCNQHIAALILLRKGKWPAACPQNWTKKSCVAEHNASDVGFAWRCRRHTCLTSRTSSAAGCTCVTQARRPNAASAPRATSNMACRRRRRAMKAWLVRFKPLVILTQLAVAGSQCLCAAPADIQRAKGESSAALSHLLPDSAAQQCAAAWAQPMPDHRRHQQHHLPAVHTGDMPGQKWPKN